MSKSQIICVCFLRKCPSTSRSLTTLDLCSNVQRTIFISKCKQTNAHLFWSPMLISSTLSYLYLVTSGAVTSLAKLLSLLILSNIFLNAKLLTQNTKTAAVASQSPSPSPSSSSHSSPPFILSGVGTLRSTLDLQMTRTKESKKEKSWYR